MFYDWPAVITLQWIKQRVPKFPGPQVTRKRWLLKYVYTCRYKIVMQNDIHVLSQWNDVWWRRCHHVITTSITIGWFDFVSWKFVTAELATGSSCHFASFSVYTVTCSLSHWVSTSMWRVVGGRFSINYSQTTLAAIKATSGIMSKKVKTVYDFHLTDLSSL